MKKYIAEAIGTFVLVLFACGAAVGINTLLSNGSNGEIAIPLMFSTLGIAFAFGLVIVAMAYSIGNISGCHINPAVSFGMWVSGRMSGREFFGYIVSQFIGALAGSAVLGWVLGSYAALGANGFGDSSALHATMYQAFIVEVVLTFVFVIAVIGVTSKKEYASVAGLVIGFSLTLVHIFGIPFTGTSVNPARSFAPAVFQGGEALSQVWLFIVAPLVGALIAAVVYKYLAKDDAKTKAGENS